MINQTNDKKKNSTPKRLMLVGLVIMICMIVYSGHLANRYFDRTFKIFDASELNGKITFLYASKSGEKFRLDNQSMEYNFISKMTAFNNYSTLYAAAEKGDRVFKRAFADTLYLIKTKTGQVIRFTFEKSKEAPK